MPHGELHKKKKKKNLMIFGLVLLWCALIWMVTMIKMASADEGNFHYAGRNYSGIDIERKPVDIKAPMYNSRFKHEEKSAGVQQQWLENFQDSADERRQIFDARELSRVMQQGHVVGTQDEWQQKWYDTEEERLNHDYEEGQRRAAHYDATIIRKHNWWDDWTRRQQEKSE